IQAADAAGAADFFSIGSNDLTQYVLAADRGNERVSGQFSATHPAVWKLIRTSYEAAEEAGIPISICGEMAGKPLLAAALLGMGINDLSMNPASIPFVKQLLCNYEIKIFKELLESILKAADGKGADAGIADWQKKYIN
ncbi:MAG: putative PEP-binding protein, partial [Balneolaceae bacterium]